MSGIIQYCSLDLGNYATIYNSSTTDMIQRDGKIIPQCFFFPDLFKQHEFLAWVCAWVHEYICAYVPVDKFYIFNYKGAWGDVGCLEPA